MNSRMDAELRRLLRPYRRRVRVQRLVVRTGLCACAGVGAGMLLLLVSFLVPIPNAPALAVLAGGLAGLLTGVALAVLRRQPPVQLAMEVDRHGFAERVQTMYALQGDDSAFARLQRADTVRALRTASAKERIPVVWPKKLYALAGVGVLAACVLTVLPNPHAGVLQQRAEIRQVMRGQMERVEAGMELLKDSSLSDIQKAELNDRLRELAKELRDGRDYREAVRQISELQRQLDELQRSQGVDELQALLAEQDATAGLADGMAGQTPERAGEQLHQAVRQALQHGREGDDSPQRELVQALRDAADNAGNERLRDALNGLADALEAGDEDAVAEAMQELQDALDGDGGSDDSLAQIGDALKLAKSRMGQLSQDDAPGGDPSRAAQSGQQPGDASGSGQQPGNSGEQGGADGGQGPGGSQGEQVGSGGARGEDDGSGGQPGGGGAGAGSGELVESEQVYSGERLGAEGVQEFLQGEIDADGPRQQAEAGPGTGTLDGYIPYHDVAGEYAEDAINAAKREELPPAVQGWVEGYFSALQD